MSSNMFVLKAKGLNTSPNELDREEGSLIEANNIIIRRDGVIEPTRGFKLWGTAFPSSSDTAKQLFAYRNRILRHYSNKLDFDNQGDGNFVDFSDNITEAVTNIRMKSIESNGNLYLTSNEGIKKLSAKTADDLSTDPGFITNAGGVKAVDFTTQVAYTAGNTTGFLEQDSSVAYRIVWATKDNNNNLILGAPSQREIVVNKMSSLIANDFVNLLVIIDSFINPSLTSANINDGDYVDTLKVTLASSADDLRTKLIDFTTKLDNDIFIGSETVATPLQMTVAPTISSGVCEITFSTGDPTQYLSAGKYVTLSGFNPTTLNGTHLLSSVTSTAIYFTTTVTGAVTFSGSSEVRYGEYKSIPQPSVPSLPATHNDLVELQDYLSEIVIRLQNEPDAIIDIATDAPSVAAFTITNSASVKLNITIPEQITSDYFYQIYRSALAQAIDVVSIEDVVPDDELQLVYEAYPTSQELLDAEIIITDNTPDDFRGANLYTNASSGEGILQSNDMPPFASDINRFKGSVFYANTRTKHRLSLNLLGVIKLIDDYNNLITPQITIASTDGITNTYSFVTGLQHTVDIQCVDNTAHALDGKYFYLDTSISSFYIWFFSNAGVDPAISGKTGIKVTLDNNATAIEVASKLRDVLSSYLYDFSSVSSVSDLVTTVDINYKELPNAVDVDTTFAIINTAGRGEDASINQVLLSTNVSPAIAVDETARSLIRIINKNVSESVSAFYLSSVNDVPGKILLEERDLSSLAFYISANNATTGSSFNPDLSPVGYATALTPSGSNTIITKTSHGFVDSDFAFITNSDTTPAINGLYEVSYIDANTFSIPYTITVAGTTAGISSTSEASVSENEIKPNRVYYSKYQQPEAVPISNYFDVGAEEKAIIRIYPLRDSLFVFKEDGLYRISGESIPFSVTLFDGSFKLIAPDSVCVVDNLIYAWSSQGIQVVSESGIQTASRPIDNLILKLASSNYTNFRTATWGIGYSSESAIVMWTINSIDAEHAEIGFRYNTLTNSWTTLTKSPTCGIILESDNKMYLGMSDINYIEQERKSYDRTDYANRQYESFLSQNRYYGNKLRITNISNVSVGDVLVQNQYLTIYRFNSLLSKLDLDLLVADSNYESLLTTTAGLDIRTSLEELCTKLDNDSGVNGTDYNSTIASKTGAITSITSGSTPVLTKNAHGLITGRKVLITSSNSTPSINGEYIVTVIDANKFSINKRVTIAGTSANFVTLNQDSEDIKACFNKVITKLNTDSGVGFTNYSQITTVTPMEAVIRAVNYQTGEVTLNKTLQYVVGDLIVFKAIPTSYTYSPNTFGDPLNYKQIRQATLMMDSRAITQMTLQFKTDLKPSFIGVDFTLDGNGIFGNDIFGEGFFGGASNAAPVRTLIPIDCQRCRYMVMRFKHNVARENYQINGITLTGNVGLSEKAYR